MAEHVVKPKTYILVFAALMVLTATTIGVSLLDLGPFDVVIALAIAVTKATLVALFFMHVIYSSRLTWVVVLSGLLWLAFLIFLTMNDYLTRQWFPIVSY